MSQDISSDVLVIGAGPAGIAAATIAAEQGLKVIVLDDNRQPGGQIWRNLSTAHHPSTSKRHPKQQALDRLYRSGAQLLTRRVVFNASASGFAEALHETATDSNVETFRFQQLILATGARERFLPFPGWTLPGVFGVGGLQALTRAGYPVAGKHIAVTGTGPLLLAVAAHLVAAGATVTTVAEQAPMLKLAPFAASLWRQPAKLVQGARYRTKLRSATYRTGCWVVKAIASPDSHTLSAIHMTDGTRTWTEPCDLLACGYYLVPNTELAQLLGCALRGSFVQTDAHQRTSILGIFCVGEPTGIAGLEAAIMQGKIAGLACAGKSTPKLLRRVMKQQVFAKNLEYAFALRQELRSLPKQDTIVCRCEDVTFAAMQAYHGWTDAKLQTRCGMGPCQGRVCGPAAEFLLGWKPPISMRQPLYPVPLRALSSPLASTSKVAINKIEGIESTKERI